MKNNKIIIIFLICIALFLSCASTKHKKESGFQTSCQKGNLTHTTKLSDMEIIAYSIQLPLEIHENVEKSMKEKRLIEAITLIRGCLDIDLVSTKGITDRIKTKLNLE